jgi:hypothetical protein
MAIGLHEWIKEYTDHPSQELLKDGCYRLFHAFALLTKTQSEILVAYVAFRKQVELTYFMSISLFAMGICARMQYLIQDLMNKIQDTYDQLKDSSFKLPNVLSLQEFINWNIKQDEPAIVVENVSSSEDEDVVQVEKVQSVLSDEFWLKAESVKTAKNRKLVKKSKKKDDLDIIFGLLD